MNFNHNILLISYKPIFLWITTHNEIIKFHVIYPEPELTQNNSKKIKATSSHTQFSYVHIALRKKKDLSYVRSQKTGDEHGLVNLISYP